MNTAEVEEVESSWHQFDKQDEAVTHEAEDLVAFLNCEYHCVDPEMNETNQTVGCPDNTGCDVSKDDRDVFQ